MVIIRPPSATTAQGIPFQSPITVTPGGATPFPGPLPGRKRRIEAAIVSALTGIGALTVQSDRQGLIFAAGAGQNQSLGNGSYQFVQPQDWFSGGQVYASATVGSTAIAPDKFLGSTTTSTTSHQTITVGSAVPVGDTVVVMTGRSNSGGITNITLNSVTDSRGNIYAVPVKQGSTTLTTAIALSQITTALQIGDTITLNFSNTLTGSVGSVAQSFTNGSASSYGGNTGSGSSTNPIVSMTANTNAGDLILGCAANAVAATSDNLPAGWSTLQSPLASMAFGYLISASGGSPGQYSGTLSSSDSWQANVIGVSAGTPTNPMATVTLTGTEYDDAPGRG